MKTAINSLPSIMGLIFSIGISHISIAQCDPQATGELNVNNITAKFGMGDLWVVDPDNWNNYRANLGGNQDYEVGLISGWGLWVAGFDQTGQLRISTTTYDAFLSPSFVAGPLNPETGMPFVDNCENWDRFFEVYKNEVNAHIADYTDNGQIDGPVSPNILGWPGSGNPEFYNAHGFYLPDNDEPLAPFFDRNQNGNYEPYNGDYPLIKGEQAFWWVFNDHVIDEPTDKEPVPLEVHCMAFAESSNNVAINNSTFFEFSFINRLDEPLDSFVVGLWIDPEIIPISGAAPSCTTGDFIGCSPEDDLVYFYKGNDLDADCYQLQNGEIRIPAVGVKLLECENQLEVLEWNSLMYFFNPSVGNPPVPQTDPSIHQEYYNYMTGSWRDGTPLSLGGNGYDLNTPDPHSYVFDETTIDGVLWQECLYNDVLGDRRLVIGAGGVEIGSGDRKKFNFAIIHNDEAEYPCPDMTPLKEDAAAVQQFYADVCDAMMVSVGEAPVNDNLALVFPNPATESVSWEMLEGTGLISSIEVFNSAGQRIHIAQGLDSRTYILSDLNWPAGLYYFRLRSKDDRTQSGKLVLR